MANLLRQIFGAFIAQRPFTLLGKAGALLVLGLLVGAMVRSAFAVPNLDKQSAAQAEAKQSMQARSGEKPAIGDFELYSLINERVGAGENYYAAAMDAQRVNNYPTKPFVTVRLPTLAMAHKFIGSLGVQIALWAMLGGLVIAAFMRFGEGFSAAERSLAAFAVFLGGAGLFAEQAPLIHEQAAGLALSLALLLYRQHRWWPSLLLAALALALRELALPFVLLWLAFAACEKRWREAGAVAGLIAIFAMGLYLHYLGVSAHSLVTDRQSPGWDGLVGPALPLLALSKLSALLFAPLWLAAPLAILSLFGWAGIGGRLGAFASLWFAGFFLAMALFARAENFYWVLLTMPAFLAGLVFVPRALADLFQAATRRGNVVVESET